MNFVLILVLNGLFKVIFLIFLVLLSVCLIVVISVFIDDSMLFLVVMRVSWILFGSKFVWNGIGRGILFDDVKVVV